MAVYGKTWWGKEWLEGFQEKGSRFSSAKGHATKGLVASIAINDHSLSTRVHSGNQYDGSFKVEIVLKHFSDEEKETIRRIITESPLILSMLLNNKLPLQMSEKLKEAGIHLFPPSAGNLKGSSCTCRWGDDVCKHILATMYALTARIDQNPFLLFEARGCNLLTSIDAYREGNLIQKRQVTSISDLIQHYDYDDTKTLNIADLEGINLSKMQNLFYRVTSMLPDNPAFCEQNFLSILKEVYIYWQNNIEERVEQNTKYDYDSNLSKEMQFIKNWKKPERLKGFDIVLDDNYDIDAISYNGIRIFFKTRGLVESLVQFLYEIPDFLLQKCSYKVRFAHALYQYAVKALQKSAIVPQILEKQNDRVFIRWIPALFDENVKEVFDKFCELCPRDFVIYEGVNLSPAEQIKVAFSAMISGLIKHNIPLMPYGIRHLSRLFFGGEKLQFLHYYDLAEIPEGVRQWLACLHNAATQQHKLYLTIEEENDGLRVMPQVMLKDEVIPTHARAAMKNCTPEEKLSILSDLSLMSEYFPNFDKLFENDSGTILGLKEFSPLFFNTLPILQSVGVTIVLPRSLRDVLKPSLNLHLKSNSKISHDRESFLSLDTLLEFDWKIAIGNSTLSVEEFKNAIHNAQDIVKIVDSYVILDPKEIALILKSIERIPKKLERSDLMQAVLAGEFEGASVALDSQLQGLVTTINSYDSVAVPPNLNATLRPYQERGFNWLMQNISTGFGSILADDMGLGKTIQVISAILHLKNNNILTKDNRVIVVAPTSLLSNWEKEIAKFAPNINVCIYHGNKRELLEECDVVITSYGLMRRDQKQFNAQKWLLIVVDEAQNIKNPHSEQAKAVKSIDAIHKIAMSGTPVENRLLEYWSIFDFTNKGYLGSPKQFRDRYASAIEKERDKDCLNRFKKVTSPFILRRIKSDKTIIADLPDKVETNRYCTLSPEQTALYQSVVDNSMKKIAESDGIERKGLVLKLINSLKQVCNHPSQFAKKLQDASIAQSGKTLVLEEILEQIDAVGEKCLIFTQYVEMGKILVSLIEQKMGIEVPFLHGGVSRNKRDKMVEDFQDLASNMKFFIISLQAGGTGLNLTAASHVIHYDLWWNPAVEHQATDRAYRIGQHKNVMVHRFITTGTFEERIDEMLTKKRDLANLAVSDGENWITEMTSDEITDLVSLRRIEA